MPLRAEGRCSAGSSDSHGRARRIIIMYVLLSADEECGCAHFILIDLVHTSAGEQSHRCVSERSH